MRLLCVVLCVLTLTSYLVHHLSTDTPPFFLSRSTNDRLSGRRFMKEPRVSASKLVEDQNVKANGALERLETKGDSTSGGHNSDDDEGIIYNVDYHGVATHPSPLPKHPKP